MNKKLLLINLPGESVRKPEEHCGLAFLKAYTERNGFDVQIIDAYALRLTLAETLMKIDEWMKEYENNVLYIGISPFVTSHKAFVSVGEYIKSKSKECYVFAGGHYASLNRERLLNSFDWLDAIIVGEGEHTLLEFLKKGLRNDIPGLYVGQDENSFIKRLRIKNLDELPFQARYLTVEELDGQPMAITTSRGCYGACSFCSISSFYQLNECELKQTYRSASSVSDEIHLLVEKYGIESLKIVDDNFFRDKSDTFLDMLASKIADLQLKIRLSARPNDITENRVKQLKKMGVTVVGIGAESADERSLSLYNKGIGIRESIKAIELLEKYHITCLINYIMFNPIIDLEGLEKNLDFVDQYKCNSIFHRINSHLWIRSTDPLVKTLENLGLCNRIGFPYLECTYACHEVYRIMEVFNRWCNHNMKAYYENVDVLMANGIEGNENCERSYRQMLFEDIRILRELINLAKENKLEKYGKQFIDGCLANGGCVEGNR